MKRLALAAALAATLASLTSCADAARPVVSYTGSYGQPGRPAPADLIGLPSFTVGPTGISTDVTTEQCTTDQGEATASGSATNTGRFQRDVVVAVTWVDLATGRPAARTVASLPDLAPAESRDWGIGTRLDRPGLACTVAAYAGQLG